MTRQDPRYPAPSLPPRADAVEAMPRQWLFRLLGAVLLCCALLPPPAGAQGRGEQFRTRGLIFDLPPDVQVERLDVDIALHEIRLRYVFRAKTAQRMRLGFTLAAMEAGSSPDQVLLDEGHENEGYRADRHPLNYQALSISVNGKNPPLQGRGRALQDGKDVTRRLLDAGVPLLFGPDETPPRPITPQARATLDAAGLYADDYANWRYQSEFYWEQTLLPGETRIEVRFAPTSESWGDFSWDNFPESDPGLQRAGAYCIDAGLRRATRGRHGDELASIAHALTSKTHWQGPVGRYHLTVHKTSPTDLLAFCPLAANKTSPTTFEWSARESNPPAHLDVLYFIDPEATPPGED